MILIYTIEKGFGRFCLNVDLLDLLDLLDFYKKNPINPMNLMNPCSDKSITICIENPKTVFRYVYIR